MTDDEQTLLLALLSPELRAGVDEGRFKLVGPGKNPEKPVVVNATTGRWVRGSGRPLNANDPAEVGKKHGFKHSNNYQEAMDMLVPAFRTGNEYAIMTLEELLVAAKAAVLGDPLYEKQTCPECETTFVARTGTKRDSKVLVFLIERLIGAAQKKTDVNVHSEELIHLISDTRVLAQIEVVSLTPEVRAARARAISEAN